MDMKDRVDGFLKVTRERVLETEPTEVMWNMNDLYNDLRELVAESKDQDLLDSLTAQWEKIWHERKAQKWDEQFLKVISGEENARRMVGWENIGQDRTLTVPNGTGATWITQKNVDKDIDMLKEEIKKLAKEHEKKIVTATFKPIGKE